MIIDVKVPVEIVTETVGDKTKEAENKLFPGYVVKMVYTDEPVCCAQHQRLYRFVGPDQSPYHLQMRKFTEWVLKHEALLNYSVGDSVRIIDGPLEDFVGVVEEIDADKDYVRVVVSVRRETRLNLFAQAEPIED